MGFGQCFYGDWEEKEAGDYRILERIEGVGRSVAEATRRLKPAPQKSSECEGEAGGDY